MDILEAFGKRGLLIAIHDEASEYPDDAFVFSDAGKQYGYLVEHDEGEYAGQSVHFDLSAVKLPEHAKGRVPESS